MKLRIWRRRDQDEARRAIRGLRRQQRSLRKVRYRSDEAQRDLDHAVSRFYGDGR